MTERAATILIVDDELANRKLLDALLRVEGYLTLSAASGDEALLLASTQTPDLILLDIMMPGMDGYQLAGLLKSQAQTCDIPIIMISALIDRSARIAGLTAGAEEFLTKPVDRTELWLRVRNLLRLKAYSDLLKNNNAVLEEQVRARTADLQRFRTAMDSVADAIFLIERGAMRLFEVNATATAIFGHTRLEWLALGAAALGQHCIDQATARFDAMIASGDPCEIFEVDSLRKDGTLLHAEVQLTAQRAGDDWIMVCVVRDMTLRKAAELRLHQLAHYDTVTGLPNRSQFLETLATTLRQAAKNGVLVSVLWIDLDHFKDVNNSLGHTLGDALLRQLSSRLVQCVRVRDTVGRLSGDEFVMILAVPESREAAVMVAKTIRDVLRTPFELESHRILVTASIGIAVYPVDGVNAEDLLKFAETAMYQAKQAGRDTFRFFTAQMNVDVLARLELEADLRRAVACEEFLLYYQPKVDLRNGKMHGFEALLRWQRPGHGLVQPQAFIAVLEDIGLIGQVGFWVIAAACRQIAAWKRSGFGAVRVAVNVSARQFIECDLEADVVRALEEYAVPPEQLELELTEGTLMANTERTIHSLSRLRERGVQVSVDDFGTGYSSLAYLRRFPVNTLKIDIAFVRDLARSAEGAEIVLAIIRLAHSLNLEVIAEGVETEEQLDALRYHRCDLVQGYYFSPPLAAADAESFLRDDYSWPVSAAEKLALAALA